LLHDRFAAIVRESNRQSRDAWTQYSGHRARVTGILTTSPTSCSSLCILGAGNLNDLRLDQLLRLYAEVHLVDLDVAAVRAGLARQGLAQSEAIQVHGPIDLSGILDRLPTDHPEANAAESLRDLLAHHRCVVPGWPFDVTVSAGLLTQLLQSVIDSSLPPRDVAPVSLALRDKHLADLVRLTRPGGTLLLVTDVVSTTTAPQLLEAAPAELEDRMAELVASRNFFTGTNPYRIVALLEEHDRFRGLVTDVRLLEPWLWRVTADRQHLTCAILARHSRLVSW
jgi:hypothetical protein